MEQLSGLPLWRTRSGAGKLSRMAAWKMKTLSGQQVRGWERSSHPYSQTTRMSGAPGCSAGKTALAVGGDVLKGAAIAAPLGAVGSKLAGALEGATATTELAAGEAHSATNLLNLNKSLASEAQMGEAGTPIAGAGTNTVLRDADPLANDYGGNPGDWSKMGSSNYQASDGSMVETHWYQNDATGSGQIEPKTKIDPN